MQFNSIIRNKPCRAESIKPNAQSPSDRHASGLSQVSSRAHTARHLADFCVWRAGLWRNPDSGRLQENHEVPRGFWLPTEHLLLGPGKPRRIFIQPAGRRTFLTHTDCSQGFKYTGPDGSRYCAAAWRVRNLETCHTATSLLFARMI
jgi:hypothetical protein